ncbi:uncharacterized protein [Eurosta solidaginis]|uniref:uncharacterized protein n=1 Tax=Eurosta solidaginis TaxID=178769 RepID=UPI0035311A81
MTEKLPTISVTEEDQKAESQASEDSNSNDMDYNFNNSEATDVEDFDSQVDSKKFPSHKSSPHKLNIPKITQTDNNATDIEDYNDSDSEVEDDNSNVYPELKLPIHEFLEHGLCEESNINNEARQNVETKPGDFLRAQNLNQINDYLTDCEDYNTDSEIENACEKSACVDLDVALCDLGKVDIAERAQTPNANEQTDEYEDPSAISDVSDIAAALRDIADGSASVGMRGMSEDEMLEISGDEEELHIFVSDESGSEADDYFYDSASFASIPPINVAFISTGCQQRRKSTTISANKTAFLTVNAANTEEVLTDIEKFDDSAAEDSFDSESEDKSIPRAVILNAAAGGGGGANDDDYADITDVEDIFGNDSDTQSSNELVNNVLAVTEEILPPVHREMIVLKENKAGDITEMIMPIDAEYQFGICCGVKEDIPTDDDDFSCTDDLSRRPSVAECINAESLIEGDVTVLNETLKPQMSKRLELQSNNESITDVEEIYVDVTNRKKKLKRSISKGKNKLLVVQSERGAAGGTDVEDMEFSDRGLPADLKTNTHEKREQAQQQQENLDKNIDKEDVSADEITDNEAQSGNVDASTLKAYIMSKSNIVVTIETAAGQEPCSNAIQRSQIQNLALESESVGGAVDNTNPPNTDIEDGQCASEEADEGSSDNAADEKVMCDCKHLNEMLNESYTVVHEQNVNSFNLEAEKLHIKSNFDTRETHTDIEYVESD